MNGLNLGGPSIHVLIDDQKLNLDLADQINNPDIKLKYLELCYHNAEPPIIPVES